MLINNRNLNYIVNLCQVSHALHGIQVKDHILKSVSQYQWKDPLLYSWNCVGKEAFCVYLHLIGTVSNYIDTQVFSIS